MHTNSLLTSAIALALWAPHASAQDASCTSSPKASPVTVRLLQDCGAAEAKASPVARLVAPAAAEGLLGRLVSDATVTQDDAVRTLAALGYVGGDAPAASANERGYLGIVMDVEDGAMIVRRVMDGSPAAKAGLKPGDRITRLGDHKVRNQESLTGFLQGLKAGSDIELRVVRDGWVKELGVGLAPLSSIEVDESPLVEEPIIKDLEVIEEPIVQDFEVVELAPSAGGVGEWVDAGDGDAKVWITTVTEHGGQDKERKIEFKGHEGAYVIELDDVTGLAELSDLGIEIGGLEGIAELKNIGVDLKGLEDLHELKNIAIDLKGLEGLAELHVLGDGNSDDLKKRIHTRLMKDLGDHEGEHEIEIHVEHDGENLDLDALKDRIKTRVRKQIGQKAHSGHDAPHGIRIHAEHKGGNEVEARGKIIMISEDGEKREIEFKGDTTNVFEWNSKEGHGKSGKSGPHVIVERLHGGHGGNVEVHEDGNVMLFGKPGSLEKLGAAGAPSQGFFFEIDDDDHHDGNDHDGEGHHDANDRDDDEHHGANRRVIRRRMKAPSTGSFFFDATDGHENHESVEEEIEIHVEADGSGKGRHHTITVHGDTGNRAGNIRFGGHDDAMGKLREELSRLREEIARLRAEIKQMHR